jgi:AcrR family transcriptional regulator
VNRDSKESIAVLPLRKKIQQATETTILTAAEEVFAEQGIEGARVGDVAHRAGVAVGTLYNHFGDRAALLVALFELRRGELLALLDAAAAAASRSGFRGELAALLGAYLGYFAEHRNFFRILLQGELACPGSTRRDHLPKPLECMSEVYRRIERVIRRGVRDRSLRTDWAEAFPALLMGMMRGLFTRDLCFHDGRSEIPPADHLVDFFLEGAARRRR